jgi:hypothetical protein
MYIYHPLVHQQNIHELQNLKTAHLRRRIRSVAGNWLFSGRRWRNPKSREDRDALIAGYDALVATFPVFSRCSRGHFLKTISGFCSSWPCCTRNDVPTNPDRPSPPADDEWPPQHRDGLSCQDLESGAANLQAWAQRSAREQRMAIANDEGTDSSLHLQGGSGAGPSAMELSRSSGTAEPEVTRVRLNTSYRISLCPPAPFLLHHRTLIARRLQSDPLEPPCRPRPSGPGEPRWSKKFFISNCSAAHRRPHTRSRARACSPRASPSMTKSAAQPTYYQDTRQTTCAHLSTSSWQTACPSPPPGKAAAV